MNILQKAKSFQIILLGYIAQVLVDFIFASAWIDPETPKGGDYWVSLLRFNITVALAILLGLLVLLPILLLAFRKTAKAGAIIAIVFGILLLLFKSFVTAILAVSLLFAGILYFWQKKQKSKSKV